MSRRRLARTAVLGVTAALLAAPAAVALTGHADRTGGATATASHSTSADAPALAVSRWSGRKLH